MSKKQLGQFFTTNYDYILQNMYIPENVKNIIEPFTGNGDLLNFISDKDKYNIECYDIEPKNDFTIQKDTLDNPPNYKNKFIITNPPYLARNKNKNKYLYDKYDTNDLYKCFIKELIINKCLGGIVIVPLNFWCSIRVKDTILRKEFLNTYKIILNNVFEEKVFDDTTYCVCCFQFYLKKDTRNNNIPTTFYPSNKKIDILLNNANNYIIGGELYKKNKTKYTIERLTKDNINKKNTNIKVKCIDDNENNKIKLSIVDDNQIYIDETDNKSARTFATLVINPEISLEIQNKLVKDFNEFLEKKREEYNSLFLVNYRESKKNFSRKRISFDLVYLIVSNILDNY